MWLVFKKEITELLRDKKTLLITFAIPVLVLPLLIGLAGFVASSNLDKEKTKILSYAVVGGEYAPEVRQAFENDKSFKYIVGVTKDNIKEKIKNEELNFALVIPSSYTNDLTTNKTSDWELHYNAASRMSLLKSRVNDVIKPIRETVQRRAFARVGIAEDKIDGMIKPIDLVTVSTAEKRENIGEMIGSMLPYIIFLLCLSSAMYPAMDLGAGEKERGTLETLLLAPIPRTDLVMGKFLAVSAMAVSSALLTVASLATWVVIIGQSMGIDKLMQVLGLVGLLDIILVILMLIPVACIFASVLLSMSIYAKSIKEAQSLMGSMTFVAIVPIMLSIIPGVELNWKWAMVPITNVSLAIKEILKGTIDYGMLAIIFFSTAAIAGALIAFCVHWFKKEKVLFR